MQSTLGEEPRSFTNQDTTLNPENRVILTMDDSTALCQPMRWLDALNS